MGCDEYGTYKCEGRAQVSRQLGLSAYYIYKSSNAAAEQCNGWTHTSQYRDQYSGTYHGK
ncbi:hypothetical protein CLOSBL3_10487 [Clostridiaceae bacterium BL-3]|nr:hypothetical protein CLOSBL3_10487 [Clostridiaceae bacterium BL-3]